MTWSLAPPRHNSQPAQARGSFFNPKIEIWIKEWQQALALPPPDGDETPLSCSNPYNQRDNVKYGSLNIKFTKIAKERAKRYGTDVIWDTGLQTAEDTTKLPNFFSIMPMTLANQVLHSIWPAHRHQKAKLSMTQKLKPSAFLLLPQRLLYVSFPTGLIPNATVTCMTAHMTQQQLQRTWFIHSIYQRPQSSKASFCLRSLTPQQRDERSPAKYRGLHRKTST